MTLSAGTRLGPYEIVEPLGAGGMGEVYRARDPRLDRDVAIKVLPEDVAADPGRLALFEREARAVAALNHPNILTVHDVGAHDGLPYVVTELLEGETLRSLVSKLSPTGAQVLGYALQAARGLEAAHAKAIVHRDLKPENLFLTTEGRVKVLDFGLAKLVRQETELSSDVSTAARSTPPGQVAGTVLYMSPEQARAQAVDVRSDVFSFGVVLYELLAHRHPFRKDTVAGTLTAIVEETPAELESLGRGVSPAVGGIVRRCLEKGREERYASGHDIAVALETVLAAPSSPAALREIEERSPYPGLSAFTEKDAAVFFGREEEARVLWEHARAHRLLGVIGPSGAGKSSFVRAGVLASRPGGWGSLVCTPGSAPFRTLAQGLVAELAGDEEALRQLLSFEDPDVAVKVLTRWRERHGEALLIVDQFEELFTLNPPEVQEAFATLLGRLATEADVRVLLSLRDDFLIRCCEQPPLAPVLQNLTALLALSGADLRRALEEPAKKRGYRFEDEALVDEMVQAVEGARAALPLLAFAVSRLWEKRDRDRKLLTRAAYEEIGGVAGALAQHAEQTLERIGSERQAVVREIFRNLVTSQGTRAAAEREELLSVCPDREAAGQVLDALIDARLLTSYEVATEEVEAEAEPSEEAQKRARDRIEIAHESLLKAWPRLVRWQAQDEEGAVLRDQLKQAAHLWEEKGRSDDLLWTGTAYQEYELWRQRYAGKLTAAENDFTRAMVEHVDRARRRRRLSLATVIAILAAGLVSVAGLWRRSEEARETAVSESLRAEASKLLALGQLELERYPTAAVAYATRSLELHDTPEARIFALRALQRGPVARILTVLGEEEDASPRWAHRLRFRPGGSWLAMSGYTGVQVWPRDGGEPLVFDDYPYVGFTTVKAEFGPSGDILATGDSTVDLWAFPGGERLASRELEGTSAFSARGKRLITSTADGESQVLRSWPFDGGEPQVIGRMEVLESGEDVDPAGTRLAWARGPEVYVRSMADWNAPPRRVGSLDEEVGWVLFDPSGTLLAASDRSGQVRIWPVVPGGETRSRDVDGGGLPGLAFDPTGSRLAVFGSQQGHPRIRLWDLDGPPDAAPLELRRTDPPLVNGVAFDPEGQWLATAHVIDVGLWPLDRRYPVVLSERPSYALEFTADGKRLVAVTGRSVRSWPFTSAGGEGEQVLLDAPKGLIALATTVRSDRYLVGGFGGTVLVGSLAGGPARRLEGFAAGSHIRAVAFDLSGRYAAAAPYTASPEEKAIRVWDLERGVVQVLGPTEGAGEGFVGGYNGLQFLPDGRLLSSGDGLRLWSLDTGTAEVLQAGNTRRLALSADGRRVLYVRHRSESGASSESRDAETDLHLFDLETLESRGLELPTSWVSGISLGPSGRTFVAAADDGRLFVGSTDTNREPHLLLGHEAGVTDVDVSVDGRWIASASQDGTIRLWPTPDPSQPPFHTLPHDRLMEKLRALTNLRAVEGSDSPTGYTLEVGPFPGWETVPTW